MHDLLIRRLVLQHRLPQNRRLQKHWDQKLVKTPSKFAIFYLLFSDLVLGTFQFSSLVFHDCRLKFSEQKQKPSYFWAISVSSKRNIKCNDFELVLSRQTCQRNHVLNYASWSGLGGKEYATSFAPS